MKGQQRLGGGDVTNQGCQATPGAGRGKEILSPRDSGGVWLGQHLELGLLAFTSMRGHVSIVLSHPVCCTLLWEL